jgi:tRNA (guanine-N7-)-methyltransferase
MSKSHKPKFIRSFGRVKSRKLSDRKKDLLESLLPKYQIQNSNYSQLNNSNQSFSNQNYKKVILEIGFGFGDFLFENAKNQPDTLFIGCEPHINGVINLLSKLEKTPLSNIRIFIEDSRVLLEEFPEEIFDKIYILNPDPWPKSKHHKRRLINCNFLHFLKPKAKKNAPLIITTDDNSYKKWIMAEYFKNNLWSWQARSKKDWEEFPKDWTETKYQKKAKAAGRENIFLKFI